MDDLANFFDMGGYAAFVWSSLGLTAAVMGGLLVATLHQLRARQRRLAALEARGAPRARRSAALEATSSASVEAPR